MYVCMYVYMPYRRWTRTRHVPITRCSHGRSSSRASSHLPRETAHEIEGGYCGLDSVRSDEGRYHVRDK